MRRCACWSQGRIPSGVWRSSRYASSANPFVPRHIRANADEIVYVLDGHLIVNLDGAFVEVFAGSCITLPRNVEHCYRVVSVKARLLVIVTPAGFEGYYREISMLNSSEVEHLVTTAGRYGVTITGPAI